MNSTAVKSILTELANYNSTNALNILARYRLDSTFTTAPSKRNVLAFIQAVSIPDELLDTLYNEATSQLSTTKKVLQAWGNYVSAFGPILKTINEYRSTIAQLDAQLYEFKDLIIATSPSDTFTVDKYTALYASVQEDKKRLTYQMSLLMEQVPSTTAVLPSKSNASFGAYLKRLKQQLYLLGRQIATSVDSSDSISVTNLLIAEFNGKRLTLPEIDQKEFTPYLVLS